MAHTPGPWVVDDGSKSVLGGFTVQAKTGRPKPTPSATGYAVIASPWPHGPSLEDRRMQEANARLIAAAPDLLAALKAIKADLTERKIGVTACSIADTAISRATANE